MNKSRRHLKKFTSWNPKVMPQSKELDLAIRYLQQVLTSKSLPLISRSCTALLDAVCIHCDNNDPRLQDVIVRLLRSTDSQLLQVDVPAQIDEMKEILAELNKVIAERSRISNKTTPTDVLRKETPTVRDCSPEAPRATISEMEDPQLDDLLQQLNIRQVPKFAPVFPDLGGDSEDDEAVTTDERKEERAEKHGQKLCEEEVQKMADGREVRTKKTRTVNTSQSSKSVTISTKGGGCPSVSRRFVDGTRSMNEDEEEENTDFFARDPFDRFRKQRSTLQSLADTPSDVKTGESTKTRTLERTSEVSQNVSQKKEKNGQLLAEHESSKLDQSDLKATMIDKYLGEKLLDRKGEGSYSENTTIKTGKALTGEQPVPPPRKHVVEYIQTFGNKDNTDNDYFRGTTLASYIQLNDNLRFHEEQFQRKLQFEFSSAGMTGCGVTPDFSNLGDLLQGLEFGAIKLPSKFAQDDELATPRAIDWLEKSVAEEDATVCVMDASEYLVMRQKEETSKPPEVRGGPKDALIVYSTQPSSSLLYQEAFLVTYRSFVSSQELINKLVKRYLYMSMASDKQSQSAAKQCFSVLVRVVDELAGVELTEELVTSTSSFVYRLIRDGNFQFARILRKRLMERIEDRRSHLQLSNQPKISSKKPTLFDFRSSHLAAQMTVIDSQLFQLIEPAELLWWAQEQDEKKSPNLVNFTEHFNNVSFWVRSLVICPQTQKEREKYMNKFIKVMKHLRHLCNFNSYLAVLSALVSSPISRLEWNSHILGLLKDHSEVMDTALSYKSYRALLQQAAPPCVPYIGVVLQDLTFVHAGNPDKIPAERCQGRKDMINFLKRWHQYAILESVRKMKRWSYDAKRDDRIQQFFDNFHAFLSEEETWARSHEVKPTMRRRP